MNILPIIEVYPCIQGEGSLSGTPSIMIRTTGCRLRCQFGIDGFCDTWYASWKPEKAQFTYEKIKEIYNQYPNIHHTIISGGGPTLNSTLLKFFVGWIHKEFEHHITLETEGSDFYPIQKTDDESVLIDLVSLSPKLSNSTPILGTKLSFDENKEVTEKIINQHEKYRLNYEAMGSLLANHKDYQIKPVICNPNDSEVKSIEDQFLEISNIITKAYSWLRNNAFTSFDISKLSDKIYLMPAGTSIQELEVLRPKLMEFAMKKGVKYTDRLHILAYGNQRGV